MARALKDILSELDTVYDPQRSSYNKQISSLDPQQAAEFKGLQATKEDAFGDITNQANRRGLFYSGIPVAEQQRYTGATFLPSVANLKNRYTQQRFNLQDALSGITEKQYSRAYDIRQNELNLEAQERASERAASAARASAGGGGSGFGGFSGGGGAAPSQAAPRQSAGINWKGLIEQGNPYVWADMLRDANKAYFGGKASYGQLAGWVESKTGKISNGNAADVALRNIFLGADMNTGGGQQNKKVSATGNNFWGGLGKAFRGDYFGS